MRVGVPLLILTIILGSGLSGLLPGLAGLSGLSPAWADRGSGDDKDDSGGGDDDGGKDDDSGHGGGDDGDDDNSGHGGDDDGGDDDGGGNGGNGGGTGGSTAGGSGNGDSGASRSDFLMLHFVDGHVEQVRGGVFERSDRSGRIVERRKASGSDIRRLSAYRAAGPGRDKLQGLVMVSAARTEVQVIDRNGWSEIVEGGRYQLTDPNGNLVTRRAATQDDIQRIRAMAGF